MKNIFFLTVVVSQTLSGNLSSAQTNTFPSSGNVGIGTLSPATTLQVVGTTRLGSSTNYTQVDASGNLIFAGTGEYRVGGNKYAFRYNTTNYGLYFNSTAAEYEFKDGSSANLFYLTGSGNAYIKTRLSIATTAAGSPLLVNGIIESQSGGFKFPDATVQTTAAISGANFSLSNLSSTSINQSLLPNSTNTFDLGSSALNWKNIYAAGSYYIGSDKVLDITGTENSFIGITRNTTNTGSYNTATGYYSLHSNTSGSNNTAFGNQTLQYNNTGYNNLAIGGNALRNNTSGYSNTAIGISSMYSNTTGYQNTAVGEDALYYSAMGIYNTAVGEFALYHNTGSYNTAIGNSAMDANTDGSWNTAVGDGALGTNTTGNYNTAVGNGSLDANTTGNYNSAFGYFSLFQNSTGAGNTATGELALWANTVGNSNVANGLGSLEDNTTGNNNSALGAASLFSNSSGSSNTALGTSSLAIGTTASRNTAVGDSAGYNITSGSNNTFIGYGANCGSLGTASNSTAIGNGAVVTASNIFVFGNSEVTGWGFGTGPGARAIKAGTTSSNGNGAYLTTGGVWTDISDANKKENITELDKKSVLDKILHLKISEWKYKGTEDEYHIGPMAEDFHRLFEVGDDSSISSMDKTGVLFLGIQALSGEDVRNKTEDLRQDSVLEVLKKENQELKSEVIKLKSSMVNGKSSMTDGFIKSEIQNQKPEILLGQNIPNPFDNSTLIPFRIPKNCNDASIMITNTATSEVISVIPISCNEDHISVDAGTLASGTYSYTLYVDGKMIDTKNMVLTK